VDLLYSCIDHLAMSLSTEKDILFSFGIRIRMLRKEKGLSQEAFADIAGLDRSYVGGVERGERNVSLINVRKFANALEVSVEELFQGIK
jgi:transcriptional regulator with XRE-family HTH domain